MKKLLIVVMALMFAVSAVPVDTAHAAAAQAYSETAFDRVGDWFAVLGKEGVERDRVLLERKAERVARHAERQAQRAAEEAKKTAAATKKKLGL
jgi:hypothetical protein